MIKVPNYGGYVMLDLSKYEIRASTPVTVSREDVNILKQWGKPVLLNKTVLDYDGATVILEGFTAHSESAGVHNHDIGIMRIAVTGDTQISFTML